MPKLLIFAPCEKVIIDQVSNTLSLIAVLQEVRYKTAPGAVLPPNFSIPIQWAVLTMWREEQPDDAGVEFEQRFTLATSVKPLLENVMRWTFTKPTHRLVANILGFPAGASRNLALYLSYRVVGATDWNPIASFPLEVIQELM